VEILCNLVGGMSEGDTLDIIGNDNFAHHLPFEAVYYPDPRQGKMVICWEKDGQEAGSGWEEGMMLMFFPEPETAQNGRLEFGNWDMHETLPEEYWNTWVEEGITFPCSNGLAVKVVSRMNIYTSETLSGMLMTITAATSGYCDHRDSMENAGNSPGWIPEDVNKDGVVNVGDVVTMGLHWGETW
jgi:hypothetical protein